jgi:RNA polymerase sigma factor (sigma-70 family)
MIESRRGECGHAYPEKANPNRPVHRREATQGAPGDAKPFPEKCDPCPRRSPLTEDQRKLAARYLPLAWAMVRRTRYPALERDELKSAAYVALVEAAQTFDPERNVNFATFARHRIRGAMSDFRRSWLGLSRGKHEIHKPASRRLGILDEAQRWDLGQLMSPEDGLGIEETETLESYFRRLPRAQASACRLIYIDGMSQDEAAALLGYSKAYLSRLHRDALEWLSREYEAAGLTLQERARGETWN